jgi:hypothetical protein
LWYNVDTSKEGIVLCHFFNVGDKVYKKENPNKIYTIKKRTDITHCIPNYILIDES